MGCSSSSIAKKNGLSVDADNSTTPQDCSFRTTQLTAHKAKQQARAMMKDPGFKHKPQEEQLALQRQFIAEMDGMMGRDVFSVSIAKAMQQQLLTDELFVKLLALQHPDVKEKVQLAARPSHSIVQCVETVGI